jgi:hypothetical protein
MRMIPIVFFMVLGLSTVAQENLLGSIEKALEGRFGCGILQEPNEKKAIRIRCQVSTVNATPPLIVVDGVVLDSSYGQSLDPKDIESISILKPGILLGCRQSGTVILVTTRHAGVRKFVVKDFVSGETLAGATIEFSHGGHTIMAMTNDKDVLQTRELNKNVEYAIKVSMAGYKQLVLPFDKNRETGELVIMLERDIKECDEVIVKGYSHRRICRVCRILHTTITDCGINKIQREMVGENQLKLFPIPLQKGGIVMGKLNAIPANSIVVKVFSLDGKSMLIQNVPENTGQFALQTNSNWSSGVYFVKVMRENGELIQGGKLIIQ